MLKLLSLSKVAPPDFGSLNLNEGKWQEFIDWVISNRMKYWNIEYWENLSLPAFALLGEEN